MNIRFIWPCPPPEPFREDFFFGAWHPTNPIQADIPPPPGNVDPLRLDGPNWLVLSNTSRFMPGSPGLLHRVPGPPRPGTPACIVFRGYVVDPPLHSFSEASRICDYWHSHSEAMHNGVFAVVRIFDSRLEFITDAFGVSPLYFRRLPGGGVLFASSPRYLRLQGDGLDPIAERMIVHRGALCGDVSLVPGVLRAAPGSIVTIDNDDEHAKLWFPFSDLPPGDVPITPAAVRCAEAAFQTAVERCLRLMPEARLELPLSSGNDSRRILAALHHRHLPFEALTMRILQKQDRDLDGQFTVLMAKELGFRHRVFDCAPPDLYAADDRICRNLFASELSEHAWIVPLVRALPNAPSLVFDGLGGDIFGNTGFGIPEHYTMPENARLPAIAAEALEDCPGILRDSAWASLDQIRTSLMDHLGFLPQRKNLSDYAFVLIRARRGTAPWGQHLLPSGHLPVYPYLDIDHILTTMRYESLHKLEENLTRTLQIRCLETFWPRYHAFPGSRRIPADLKPGLPEHNARLKMARLDQMRSECDNPVLLPGLATRLLPVRYLQALASHASHSMKLRSQWWLDPVLMLESLRTQARAPHSAVTE